MKLFQMNDMDKPYPWFKSILTFSFAIKVRAFLFATPQVETWLFGKRYAIGETAREAGYLQRHRNAEIGKISNRSS